MDQKITGFTELRYSQVSSSGARDLRLQERPAVYCWYRDLRLVADASTGSDFLRRLDSFLAADLSERVVGRMGFLYRLELWESAGPLSQRKRGALEAIVANDAARQVLCSIISTASVLQAPLYIGKARSLKQRVGQHVEGSSGLAGRLDRAGVHLSQCVLRFRYFSTDEIATMAEAIGDMSSEDDLLDVACVLVEELLTRITPAAFVRRPG